MFEFDFNKKTYKHIHFVGIGGVSMSGLAEILLSKGFEVSGSDANKSDITIHLEDLGAKVFIGHQKENINGVDLVVYTDAVSSDNEELVEAENKNIKIVDRASFLGAIMLNYQDSIAVSGTHGKTSTTSIIASITNYIDNFNPTILLGGKLNEIGGNIRLASEDCIITEACEYKGNILKYYPSTAIILNIDEDHLDFFKNIDHIVDTFIDYTKNIQENGTLIINMDDPNTKRIIENTREDIDIITFGVDNQADFMAKNIRVSDGKTYFDLLIHGEESHPIELNIIGRHNVYNSLAAIIAIYNHDMDIEVIIDKIKGYQGVQRRLELKGVVNGVTFLDDYAHHPTEIKTTLDAIKASKNMDGTSYCIFQPHTFTRTKILLNSFSEAFKDVDKVIITDIFAAREKNNGSIHSKDLTDAVNKISNNAIYLSSFEEIESFLKDKVKEKDLVITMGAGNIYQLAESILNSEWNLDSENIEIKSLEADSIISSKKINNFA